MKCVSNTGILMQLNFKFNFFAKKCPTVVSVVLQQVSHNKYLDKLLKKISHEDKSCKFYQFGKMLRHTSSKLIWYYVG